MSGKKISTRAHAYTYTFFITSSSFVYLSGKASILYSLPKKGQNKYQKKKKKQTNKHVLLVAVAVRGGIPVAGVGVFSALVGVPVEKWLEPELGFVYSSRRRCLGFSHGGGVFGLTLHALLFLPFLWLYPLIPFPISISNVHIISY